MATRFTLGIEEEFQLVDAQTGQLCSYVPSVLQKGVPHFGEKIKPEMLQPTIEFISDVMPDITAARTELCNARTLLSRLAQEEGLALVSAGTSPGALWWDQPRTDHPRYQELEEEYQDVGRSVLIFGLHVHVGLDDKEQLIQVFNQVRTWLPHLLALSSNSPFWYKRMTGLKSYRSVVWKRFPRSGMPEILPSWAAFERYVQDLVALGSIDNGKKIWWDVRPHAFFQTIEFRIFDMPGTIDDTLGIAALCQALVAKLVQLNTQGKGKPAFSRDYIEENKWRAMRYGLDAEVLDFEGHRRLSMRDALRELLDLVDDVVDELGSRRDINYIRRLLDDPCGTGADRQIARYRESGGDMQQVQRLLIEQTMRGVAPDNASKAEILHSPLPFTG
ncbi:putative glutamate--cysteine ligase 2 [Reticulibacter mediterranei]|uniref:Putative glutamate--cysteine ligase 2 n=1 Tax=Reticulibacter mediterranei TaxID=2778369 RepID=A0A8J3IRN8_9CHLR|nr:carboxylate-amine ligase [Reticulibacter mediterranei]GHO95655.1 putative glutamate--cysteine ligase 2 [Reticulibacter mediterranei]